jgi:hypothetical protein
MASSMVSRSRIETLIVARAHVLTAGTNERELVAPLLRFCPKGTADVAWRDTLESAAEELRGSVLSEEYRLLDGDELRRRIGPHRVTTWALAADRVLPALALGILADDAKGHAKLSSRDAWAAAIVARERGSWSDGAPPSLPAVCDAVAWQQLGLSTKPKRLPAEVRALFLQRELAIASGSPAVLVRQIAARIVDVPRTDGRSLRDGLVRAWLAEQTIGRKGFAEQVLATARASRDGVFGDRKVFISEVWRQLRREPAFADLALDDFKRRLVTEHRAGRLVLARADLVSAMSSELVSASETQGDGASFHFVVREQP